MPNAHGPRCFVALFVACASAPTPAWQNDLAQQAGQLPHTTENADNPPSAPHDADLVPGDGGASGSPDGAVAGIHGPSPGKPTDQSRAVHVRLVATQRGER